MGGLTTRQLASRHLRRRKQNHGHQLSPGYVLQDRYQIMGTLGTGGFSSVYQARDMRFPTATKLCAVKEMLNTTSDPQLRDITIATFEREANILATLEHPSIPTVYDYFTEGDRSYLVMEFIRGKDLEALLSERDEPFPEAQVLDWAIQIATVLSYLHEMKPQPVVFRDLKPSNVILDPNNRIHIIDFNIAKVFETGDKGTTIGTEGYSPPEQYRGEAGPPGDVYAFGATIHHLLTLKDPRLEPPFSFTERPIRAFNDEVSDEFAELVMRCLDYTIEKRFPHASALREGLLALKSGKDSHSRLVRSTDELLEEIGAAPAADAEPEAESSDRDTTLAPLWTFRCEDEIRSTPTADMGTVFVSTYDNNLYALDAQSGKFVWKFPAEDGMGASPCVHDGMVIVGSTDGSVYAVQQRSGRLSWKVETGGAIYSSPRIDFDHVFVGSDDGFLYAINAGSGRVAWKAQAHSAVRSTPFVSSELVYFGTESGYIFAVDLTGKTKWQYQARRAVTSSPAMADDLVIVGSLDSTVYAIDAGTGWNVWRYRTRRSIVSSPTIADGTVYIGSSDGSLYALDLDSGRKLWDFGTEGQIASTPAVWDNAVYFGSTDGYIYSVDTRRGRLRWRYLTEGHVIGSPFIHNGILYIGATDHQLYALPL
jgi:outer membrane protein assembly factor BamB/tRNA A-37 threonylcarbamoyl transferase component Bud32